MLDDICTEDFYFALGKALGWKEYTPSVDGEFHERR